MKLTDLVKQVDETYEDVTTSFGPVRVYHVPDAVVWTLKPDWEPPAPPMVDMALANGQKQRRPAKAGDAGFMEYQAELERYEKEQSDIQFAARYVWALRDIEYPADLSKPPAINTSAYVNGEYPPKSPHDVRRKFFWLTTTLLAKRGDFTRVLEAKDRMNAGALPTASDVDQVKKNSASTTEESESEPGG